MTSPLPIRGKSIKSAEKVWFGIIKGLPCYFKSLESFDGADVVPMHSKAGGLSMKSEYFTVLPGLQPLHSVQHQIGFYRMLGQCLTDAEQETVMRRLCSDAGTLLHIKSQLGMKPEDFMTDRANPEVVLRLQCLLRKKAA